jgi:Flp pilus assembly protein TadB
MGKARRLTFEFIFPGKSSRTPELLFRHRDRERDRNRQSGKERRVVRIISAAIIVTAVIAAVPITATVAPVGIIPVATAVSSIIVPVVIPSRVNSVTSVDGRVTGVNGTGLS